MRAKVRWASLLVAIALSSAARAAEPAPELPVAAPSAPQSSSSGGLTVATPPPGPAPPADEETRIDETSLGSPSRAGGPAKPVDEGFCVECFFIGAGVGVTILGIPFIAISEIARNRKESLDAWVKVQGEGADLGFAPGYGFAKADDEEERYLVAGLVVTGTGLAMLLTTVIVAATQGSRGGGIFAINAAPVVVTPCVRADGGAVEAILRF